MSFSPCWQVASSLTNYVLLLPCALVRLSINLSEMVGCKCSKKWNAFVTSKFPIVFGIGVNNKSKQSKWNDSSTHFRKYMHMIGGKTKNPSFSPSSGLWDMNNESSYSFSLGRIYPEWNLLALKKRRSLLLTHTVRTTTLSVVLCRSHSICWLYVRKGLGSWVDRGYGQANSRIAFAILPRMYGTEDETVRTADSWNYLEFYYLTLRIV